MVALALRSLSPCMREADKEKVHFLLGVTDPQLFPTHLQPAAAWGQTRGVLSPWPEWLLRHGGPCHLLPVTWGRSPDPFSLGAWSGGRAHGTYARESRPETGHSHQCARRCSVSVCWCHYRQWQGQVTSFILKDLGQIHLSP